MENLLEFIIDFSWQLKGLWEYLLSGIDSLRFIYFLEISSFIDFEELLWYFVDLQGLLQIDLFPFFFFYELI